MFCFIFLISLVISYMIEETKRIRFVKRIANANNYSHVYYVAAGHTIVGSLFATLTN
jgi:hypothetical protein